MQIQSKNKKKYEVIFRLGKVVFGFDFDTPEQVHEFLKKQVEAKDKVKIYDEVKNNKQG